MIYNETNQGAGKKCAEYSSDGAECSDGVCLTVGVDPLNHRGQRVTNPETYFHGHLWIFAAFPLVEYFQGSLVQFSRAIHAFWGGARA